MRKTVVILHGFPEILPKKASPLYNYFAAKEFNIVMPDLMREINHLNIKSVTDFIRLKLGEAIPEAIVGISMGGLIAPHIAINYPDTKLILIGTGPYLKTKLKLYNLLIKLESFDKNLILFRIVKLTPLWLYAFIYKIVNYKKGGTIDIDYAIRAKENWNAVMNISLKKISEVLELVININNTDILKKLTNKTLIFAGKSDVMMPLVLSEELNSLIKYSQLVVSDRLHYDIFSKQDTLFLDKFIY